MSSQRYNDYPKRASLALPYLPEPYDIFHPHSSPASVSSGTSEELGRDDRPDAGAMAAPMRAR